MHVYYTHPIYAQTVHQHLSPVSPRSCVTKQHVKQNYNCGESSNRLGIISRTVPSDTKPKSIDLRAVQDYVPEAMEEYLIVDNRVIPFKTSIISFTSA